MTKYLTLFVIIALLLTSVITYQLSKDSLSPPPLQEEGVNLEGFEFQNWHEFIAPNEKFTVLLPSLPQHATKNVIDQNTQEPRNYEMYVAEKPDGTIFMITLITFEDAIKNSDTDKLMRRMMNDMMDTNPNNELRSVETKKYKGLDSLDFSFGNTDVNIDAKTFVIGDTLFILARIVNVQNYNADEFNFFINSFDLSSQPKTSD